MVAGVAGRPHPATRRNRAVRSAAQKAASRAVHEKYVVPWIQSHHAEHHSHIVSLDLRLFATPPQSRLVDRCFHLNAGPCIAIASGPLQLTAESFMFAAVGVGDPDLYMTDEKHPKPLKASLPVAPAFAARCRDFQVGAAANVAGAALQRSWLGGLAWGRLVRGMDAQNSGGSQR